MNTMLPTPRDLPPLAHTRIRAELERQLAQQVRRPRRWVVPVAVTAGLTVLAAAAWILPRFVLRPDRPAAPPPVDSPVVRDLSDVQRRAIEDGCGKAAVGDLAAPRRPGLTEGPQSFRLYNLVDDDAGRAVLLYGQTAALYCTFDRSNVAVASAYGLANTGPPDGPVTVDLYLLTRAGGATPTDQVRPDVVVLAGRVGPEVARVTVAQGNQVVSATLANRSFLGRLLHPSPWTDQGAHGPVVRAYDKGGKLLATVGG